ncbi:MAG: galactokinase [Planctomycetia bacterium]|nr:galactokinase [Planctomycetia bacterium]
MTTSSPFEVVSPGRVNLIGEHTDYNDGFVLPMAIERGLRVTVHPRRDAAVVLSSDRGGEPVELDLAQPIQPGRTDWARYAAGVLAGYQRLGWHIPGFAAAITADLPAGGGLSSSAALEVAIAIAVEAVCGRPLSPADRALLCQRAEHEFAGVPCGIMDQFAVTFGREGHALLLDCRSRDIRHVPLDDDGVAVLVIDSGVKHALVDGEYAARRRQCESAAALLGRQSLRDVKADEWRAKSDSLPALERRRAGHVLTENDRVLAFVAAAGRRDWAEAGRLMRESHASLRDDYEVSCPELDLICEVAANLPGVFGCRMTGGGFGGAAVALVETSRAAAIMEQLRAAYRPPTGVEAAMFVTRPAAGGRVVA